MSNHPAATTQAQRTSIVIDGKRVLGVLIARGGSKGLPGKNVADLGGMPLIAWSVQAARSSRLLDRVLLSSDDDAIMAAARAAGCEAPFRRPAHLASDDATAADVVLHAMIEAGDDWDYVVLLQATSPFRTGADIDACITACHERNAPSCVSITDLGKPPAWILRLSDDGHIEPYFDTISMDRRQAHAPAYIPNGAVYVTRADVLRTEKTLYPAGTLGHYMPRERSADIDTALDLAYARALLGQPGSGRAAQA